MLFRCAIQLSVCSERWAELSTWLSRSFEPDCLLAAVRIDSAQPDVLAMLTTVAFGLAALAILINRLARLALRLMTFMLALFGVVVWLPRLIAHPKAHFNCSECVLTFLVTGLPPSKENVSQLNNFKIDDNAESHNADQISAEPGR